MYDPSDAIFAAIVNLFSTLLHPGSTIPPYPPNMVESFPCDHTSFVISPKIPLANCAFDSCTAVKVSFSSQEWCGNVFEILKRDGNKFTGNLFSYFEKDGEKIYNIENDQTLEPEDNLWLMVRELKGPLLKSGSTLKMKVIPSSWYRRKAHVPISVEDAVITKKDSERIKTRIGRFDANLFTWTINGKSTNVWVEKNYPHRILKWEERDGSKGVLASSARVPYWKMNKKSFEYMRRRLKAE